VFRGCLPLVHFHQALMGAITGTVIHDNQSLVDIEGLRAAKDFLNERAFVVNWNQSGDFCATLGVRSRAAHCKIRDSRSAQM